MVSRSGCCQPLPRWSRKPGSGSSHSIGCSEKEQGRCMAVFENMVWELCDTLFSLILGLEASKKLQSRRPFFLRIHCSSNFVYYRAIAAIPWLASEFLGCLLIAFSETHNSVCLSLMHQLGVVWLLLQKHWCWSKVKAQKQSCWRRVSCVLTPCNKYRGRCFQVGLPSSCEIGCRRSHISKAQRNSFFLVTFFQKQLKT